MVYNQDYESPDTPDSGGGVAPPPPDASSGCPSGQVFCAPTGKCQANCGGPEGDCGGATCGPGAHCEDAVYGKHCVQDGGGVDPRPNYGSGGSGGSSGAVAAPPPITYNSPNSFSGPLYDTLIKGIMDTWNGNNAPWTQSRLDATKGGILQTTTGRADAAKQSAGQDLIRRGLARSGVAADEIGQIDRAASTDFTSQYTQVLIKSVEDNFSAKMSALDKAQQLVVSRAQYDLANARNGLDRDIAQSTATLAMARLQQETENLKLQLQSAYDLAKMGNEAALERLLLQMGLPLPQ